MRLTHSYKNNASLHDWGAVLRTYLLTFINQHAETFDALVRSGNPFGANWLPTTHYVTWAKPAKTTGSELAHVQQQINGLVRTVALLNNRVEQLASQQSAGTKSTPSGTPVRLTKAPGNEIGINRYRALQEPR